MSQEEQLGWSQSTGPDIDARNQHKPALDARAIIIIIIIIIIIPATALPPR